MCGHILFTVCECTHVSAQKVILNLSLGFWVLNDLSDFPLFGNNDPFLCWKKKRQPLQCDTPWEEVSGWIAGGGVYNYSSKVKADMSSRVIHSCYLQHLTKSASTDTNSSQLFFILKLHILKIFGFIIMSLF